MRRHTKINAAFACCEAEHSRSDAVIYRTRAVAGIGTESACSLKEIAESEVLDEYGILQLLPKKVSPIPTLKYTTNPLKTTTIALF
jgi:hypothetical protein